MKKALALLLFLLFLLLVWLAWGWYKSTVVCCPEVEPVEVVQVRLFLTARAMP